MIPPHDEQDGNRSTTPGAADRTDPPSRRGPGLLLPTVAAAVVLALTGAAVVALRDGAGGGSQSPATAAPSPTAAAVTPPAAQVRPVHEALHDIDSRCRAKSGDVEQTALTRDVDTIIDFSRRYPDARFPIDDETGRTLSLLLVTRQSLRDCVPALAARVDGVLPSDLRDRAAMAP